MSFLSPLFLFAIAAIGLPLLIHLLNLKRPQKVAFSTLAFFKELQKTTIRKIRIKRYLLLFIRLLAIASLALVLARPFLPPGMQMGGNSQAPALNAIVLDNSVSMDRIGQKGPLLEQAKDIIRAFEQAAKDTDRFVLQLTNGEAQPASVIGASQLLRRVDDVRTVPAGNYLGQRVREMVQLLQDSPYQNKRLFVITDGQLSQVLELEDLEEIPRTISASLFNLGQVEVQNSVITNLQLSTNMIGAGMPVAISVDVSNQSEVPVSNQFVTLQFEGDIVGQYSVSIPAGATQTFEFEVFPQSSGSSRGLITIEGDEFTHDNTRYFTIQVPETRNVLWVSEPPESAIEISYTEMVLQASNKNDAQLKYQRIHPDELDGTNLSGYNAIILDGLPTIPDYMFTRFVEYVQAGGGLMFFPSEIGQLSNYNSFLRLFNVGTFDGISGSYASFQSVANATDILDNHPIFEGLFDRPEDEDLRIGTPDVYYYLKLKPSTAPGGFNIYTLNTNDPFVREKRFGEGKLLVTATGIDPGWSNFSVNPLFAPFYYRAMMYVASSDEGGLVEHILGNSFEWTGTLKNGSLTMTVAGEEIIPESSITGGGTRVVYPATNWQPGWLELSDEQNTFAVALNLNGDESEFIAANANNLPQSSRVFTMIETANIPEQMLSAEIVASGFGREIWSWFMLAGLFFLIIETLVSTFYKTESAVA